MNILLVESQPRDVEQVREALQGAPDVNLTIAPGGRIADLRVHIDAASPDIILVGTIEAGAAGIVELTSLCAAAPDVAVALLMDASDEDFFPRAIGAGAQEYLLKSEINSVSLARTLCLAIERKRYERKLSRVALGESEARLRMVTDNIPALIAYVGTDQRYRFVNEFHEEWFGQSVAELTGKTMYEVLGSEDYENCRHYIEQALYGRRVTFEQCMIKNTLERFLQITYIPEYDTAKRVIGFYVLGNNITERKLNEARLESIALYDALTGLANRLLLADRVSQAIAHAQRHSSTMALVYLDLDGFKEVNDTFGHDAGDLLLREVAERMVASLRQEDTVARLGGDEFVIALWPTAAARDAGHVAAKLIKAVSEPYDIRGNIVTLTASAGVSAYPTHGRDLDALLRSADLAMYEAKRSGKNAYRAFDEVQNIRAAAA